ncbi:tRNA-intron endonuclease [Malassezia pachydermatis]|uniref:Trna-splicing endonuclease subunit sen15 n=1 Tax=Malassezia pachydermatis TaxID=77020 RepID=A0A0N0RS86_9BASI|nr:trna-splicing endonuclease subunit sen15 [Malassezia pachydermatis]KOS13945.1 trna-splicing endonuclease subunit sen15 [Malassezia pachydermatis]
MDDSATPRVGAPLQAATHVAYAAVAPLGAKYPAQEAALFQTYVDLKYAARWQSLDVVDLPNDSSSTATLPTSTFGEQGWAVLIGLAPSSKEKQVVVPMLIEQSFTTATFSALFAKIPEGVASNHILLAMMSNDSTVVYYKLSKGMVKPVN